jgi:predicted site-specific integrase-resolvase
VTRLSARHAAKVAGVAPTTLHRWVRSGRLKRHADGYDLADILQAEASRDHDALCVRAGIRKSDRRVA